MCVFVCVSLSDCLSVRLSCCFVCGFIKILPRIAGWSPMSGDLSLARKRAWATRDKQTKAIERSVTGSVVLLRAVVLLPVAVVAVAVAVTVAVAVAVAVLVAIK